LEGFGNRIDDAVLRMFPGTYLPNPIMSEGEGKPVDGDEEDDEKILVISPPQTHSETSKLPQLQKCPKFISQKSSLRARQRA
jgi:hypothetical protein